MEFIKKRNLHFLYNKNFNCLFFDNKTCQIANLVRLKIFKIKTLRDFFLQKGPTFQRTT